MMGFVTAGAKSTGIAGEWNTRFPAAKEADLISASWLATYLGCYPNWRNEARTELKKLIMSYSLETESEGNYSSTALSSIPLSAWENETPVLDNFVLEAVRLSQAYVAFRRNVGPDMYIDGKVVPRGALVVYPSADVHLNPDLYPDPWKFDPRRPLPKDNLTYLGFGGGACFALASPTKYDLATNIDDIPIFIYLLLGAWVREDDLHGPATCPTEYQTRYRAVAHGL